mmetsp:Transcript_14365/g.25836  ORF Transcript_14365/g.25836 Transcript_14365/m.25836 type:complete len:259 (-) Transcript_14365:548-1324(-)
MITFLFHLWQVLSLYNISALPYVKANCAAATAVAGHLVAFRTQRADSDASLPHFAVSILLELFLKLLVVVWLRVLVERSLGFGAVDDAGVEFLEDWLGGLFETRSPVEGAALGCCRAVGKHPVHTILADEGVQRLGGFLYSLVEGFGRRVSVGAQHIVLGLEHTSDSAHEHTSLSGEIGVHLLFEGGLVGVASADTDGDGFGFLLGLATCIRVDGAGSVDTAALEEQSANGGSRTLRGGKDDVDSLRRHDTGKFAEHH